MTRATPAMPGCNLVAAWDPAKAASARRSSSACVALIHPPYARRSSRRPWASLPRHRRRPNRHRRAADSPNTPTRLRSPRPDPLVAPISLDAVSLRLGDRELHGFPHLTGTVSGEILMDGKLLVGLNKRNVSPDDSFRRYGRLRAPQDWRCDRRTRCCQHIAGCKRNTRLPVEIRASRAPRCASTLTQGIRLGRYAAPP